MTAEKKKEVIHSLERFFVHNKNNLLRLILAKFYRFSGIKGV